MLLNKRLSILYFINLIKLDLLLIVLYTTLTAFIRHYAFLQDIVIPLGVATLLGTLISLLLAFKTGQSYERWWEARSVWGEIVNDSRNIIRQLRQFLPGDAVAQQAIKDFAERQIIWVHALGESLRKQPFSAKVNTYLESRQITALHIPNMLLERHSDQISRLSDTYQLDPIKQVQLDTTLSRLTDAMGKCERIKNTVFPRSYSVLIKFIIYVFITIFPFGLTEIGDLAEILLSITIPLLFISIERTAIIMQDPFENRPTDTPVTNIANNIERNIREVIGEEPAAVKTPEEEDYFIL